MRLMNYIKHLTAFFDLIAIDNRLHPTHISLYMALFQYWNMNRFQNPISISRSEMMAVSKIQAKATYHKVIKELHEFGLIIYRPSYNPFRGSEVEMVQWTDNLEPNKFKEETSTGSENEPTVNGYQPKNGTATVPINEPPYKHINNTNIAYATSTKIEQVNGLGKNQNGQTKNEIKNKVTGGGRVGQPVRQNGSEGVRLSEGRPTSIEEVQQFFKDENFNAEEAKKFFNYFQSNGWKVGGRAAMKDWRAAARNWILNADAFKHKKPSLIKAITQKNYGEPL